MKATRGGGELFGVLYTDINTADQPSLGPKLLFKASRRGKARPGVGG